MAGELTAGVPGVQGSRARGRRRRANVAGGRGHQVKVRVDDAELVQLRALAEAAGVTVPRLLVAAALAGDRGVSEHQRGLAVELMAVHRLLAQISNNVNQVARATNWSGEVQDATAAVLSATRRTADRIDDLLDDLAAI